MLNSTRPGRLEDDIAVFRKILEKKAQTADELATNLTGVYDAFHAADFGHYDLGEHRAAAPEIMRAIFDLQLSLRQKIPEWNSANLMSPAAEKAARDIMRAARYAGDIIGELAIEHDRLADDRTTMRAFTDTNTNTLVSEKFKDQVNTDGHLAFQSGDVIIMRGRLHNSAAIARIGDIDSQFSHVGIVYIDPDGQHLFVESLIEEGGIINNLSDTLSHNLGRAIIFRHRDTTLAQRAAYLMYDRVRQSRQRGGKRILYDFTMRLDNERNLFCSKLVRRGFKEASDHKILLPTFPTQLRMKNRDFIDRIGVLASTTFAPGDLELEPGFNVVAEWRDYRVTSDLRLQDMVMDKIFEWMDTKGYQLNETFLIRLISIFGRASSILSDDVKELIESVIPKVPPNMSRRAIAAIGMLHSTGQELLKEARKHEHECVAKTGLPMHPREVRAFLDEYEKSAEGEIGFLKKTYAQSAPGF